MTIGTLIRRVVIVDPDTGAPINLASGLVTEAYDFLDLGYDGSNRLTSVIYKNGGAGGPTVATLTITYVGATTNIDTVTKT